MNKKYTIEIPEYYLLIIATHGKLGSGKTPSIMQTWAMRKCHELGLNDKLKEFQIRNIVELKQRIKNTLGQETIDNIDKIVNEVMNKIKEWKSWATKKN